MNNITEAYCVKCQQVRTLQEGKEIRMKNGQLALRGICYSCFFTMFKMLDTGGEQ